MLFTFKRGQPIEMEKPPAAFEAAVKRLHGESPSFGCLDDYWQWLDGQAVAHLRDLVAHWLSELMTG